MPHAAGGRPRKRLLIAPETMQGEQAYYTVPEVAALTHSHVRTIQARLRDGTLKGKKLGGTWRIYPESLTAATCGNLLQPAASCGEVLQSAAKCCDPLTVYEKVDADLNIEKR